MQPNRLSVGDLPDHIDPTLRDRIIRGVVVDTNDCWVWTVGTRLHGGHMQIRKGQNGDRKKVLAHRMVYELCVETIPNGLVVDHLCRNPPCCNPAHLEPVTQAENLRRGRHSRKDEIEYWRQRAQVAEAEVKRLTEKKE